MFYAVRKCANPNHERYLRPVEFMTEIIDDNEDDPVPLERETGQEIEEALKGHGLFDAGWVEIIEIA